MGADEEHGLPEGWKEMRSGALPGGDRAEQEEWLQRDFPGYVPGGADKMAERILAEKTAGHDAPSEKELRKRARKASGLPQGYGDAAARDGYDARTGS